MGFEPTTAGITIRSSNQLSYVHHRPAEINRLLVSTTIDTDPREWRARQDSNLRPSA